MQIPLSGLDGVVTSTTIESLRTRLARRHNAVLERLGVQ
jgi:hypothetical protein